MLSGGSHRATGTTGGLHVASCRGSGRLNLTPPPVALSPHRMSCSESRCGQLPGLSVFFKASVASRVTRIQKYHNSTKKENTHTKKNTLNSQVGGQRCEGHSQQSRVSTLCSLANTLWSHHDICTKTHTSLSQPHTHYLSAGKTLVRNHWSQ